jgi:hypothetical protein
MVVVIAICKVLTRNLRGVTGENQDKPESGQPIIRLRFETGIYRTEV